MEARMGRVSLSKCIDNMKNGLSSAWIHSVIGLSIANSSEPPDNPRSVLGSPSVFPGVELLEAQVVNQSQAAIRTSPWPIGRKPFW